MPTYEVNLVPAYGRDYTTPEQVKKDWEANKDFRIADIGQGREDGRYTSKRDWEGKWVRIRFSHLQQITIVKG